VNGLFTDLAAFPMSKDLHKCTGLLNGSLIEEKICFRTLLYEMCCMEECGMSCLMSSTLKSPQRTCIGQDSSYSLFTTLGEKLVIEQINLEAHCDNREISH
jgi:hypothetical protein